MCCDVVFALNYVFPCIDTRDVFLESVMWLFVCFVYIVKYSPPAQGMSQGLQLFGLLNGPLKRKNRSGGGNRQRWFGLGLHDDDIDSK